MCSSRRLCKCNYQLAAEKEALIERKKRRIMAAIGNCESARMHPKRHESG
ncbi:unnamed protein product [Anisakis simplex]|nr:unnamed protein product [Anisakis simplex]